MPLYNYKKQLQKNWWSILDTKKVEICVKTTKNIYLDNYKNNVIELPYIPHSCLVKKTKKDSI